MMDSSLKKVLQVNEDLRSGSYPLQRQQINLEDLLERDPIQLDPAKINGFVKNKRIMITGAAGSIGRHLLRHVISLNPKRLVLIDLSELGIYELEEELKRTPSSGTEVITLPANITDFHRMKDIFQRTQPQIIFHAAAYKHVPLMEKHPYEAIKTNILGTKILANLAVDYWVEKFVFISTDKAVNPSSIMGATKRCGEMFLQSFENESNVHTQFIIARFGNVLGTSGSVVPLFLSQIDSGGPVTITHPEVMRYFITMKEACQLVLQAGAAGHTGEVFVFNMGERILLKDFVRKMIHLSGLRADINIEIIYTGLRPGEKLLEERLTEKEEKMCCPDAQIFRSHLTPADSIHIHGAIKRMEDALAYGVENEMVLILKDAVPEYISHNSDFEKLDAGWKNKLECP